MSQNMRKLSIGAGRTRKWGYQTIDADPNANPDFLCNVPPLPDEVKQWQWIEVEVIHCIEHFYPWDAEQLLQEIYGILVPGGTLVLEQPNIDFCASVMLGIRPPAPGTTLDQSSRWGLYGDWNHRNPLMMHRFGYSPRTLTELLVKTGFSSDNIKETPGYLHVPERDFRLTAIK